MTVWDYIVLGQIPGTQIQINFTSWLFIVAVLAVFTAAANTVRNALREETGFSAAAAGTEAGTSRQKRQLSVATKLLLSIQIRRALAA
jgi:hypothetical protein